MRSRTPLLVLVAALAGLLLQVLPAAAAPTTYTAPYAAGSRGGDEATSRNNPAYGRVDANPETGAMSLQKANASPGGFNCTAEGAFAYFEVEHAVDEQLEHVTVSFRSALLDPYSFLLATVEDDDGVALGNAKFRGPYQGNGALEVQLFETDHLEAGDTIVVEFGMELSSACPSAGAGQVTFDQVTID